MKPVPSEKSLLNEHGKSEHSSHICAVMGEAFGIRLVFFGLILYNYLVVDQFSFYFGLEGAERSFSSLSFVAILSAILVAPALEEALFRWVLLKGDRMKFYIYMLFSICILFFINSYFGCVLLISFFCLLLVVNKLKSESDFLFKVFLVIAALTFSVVHIPVVDAPRLWVGFLIALMAFFPIGLFFSFSRIRFGLKYSILVHSLYNLLILGINEIVY